MTTPKPVSLKSLLSKGGIVAIPAAHDPMTARLVERAGFSALYLGGNGLGISLAKGQPLLTLTETANCSLGITRTVNIPLIVDAGAGFGSPVHVHRTVLEIESAGAAALHIDDQPYPKSPNYHRTSGGLEDISVAADKIAVAVNARRSDDFMVIARCDAWRVTKDADELVRRCKAYVQAGADGLILLDVENPDHIHRVREVAPDAFLFWIGGVVPPVLPLAKLEQLGFQGALYPFNTVAAVAEAVANLWNSFNEAGIIPQKDEFLTHMRHELSVLAGLETYWKLDDHLKSRNEAAKGCAE